VTGCNDAERTERARPRVSHTRALARAGLGEPTVAQRLSGCTLPHRDGGGMTTTIPWTFAEGSHARRRHRDPDRDALIETIWRLTRPVPEHSASPLY
jgi:hypothetical protein